MPSMSEPWEAPPKRPVSETWEAPRRSAASSCDEDLAGEELPLALALSKVLRVE